MRDVSNWDLTAPFIVAVAIQSVSWLASTAVSMRAAQMFRNLFPSGAAEPLPENVKITHLVDVVTWASDVISLSTVVLAPAAAVLISLHAGDSAKVVIAASVAVAAAVAVVGWSYMYSDAVKYAHRIRWGLTPGLIAGVVLNVTSAALIIALRDLAA